MNIESIREYCLSKKGVTEGFPFNDTALVFKVAGKMFALLDLSADSRGISLKCDPDLAIERREQYSEVTPAYHFNKIIWRVLAIAHTMIFIGFIEIRPEGINDTFPCYADLCRILAGKTGCIDHIWSVRLQFRNIT
jgi:predicted DNA-binding protein (MmcQ/YjbR family)